MVDTMTYEELIKQAEENYNVHSYQQAIDCAVQAIELDKTKPDGYYWQGIAFNRQEERMNRRFKVRCYRNGISLIGKYLNEIELKNADSLLKCKPKTATHFTYRGWTYAVKGEFEKAIDDCNTAIDIDSDNAVAYFNRGKAYAKMKKPALAIEDYGKAIEIAPGFSDVYYNRGNEYCFEHNNYDKAMADFDKAIEIDPDDAGAYFSRGLVFGITGNHISQMADFSKAIEIVPNNVIVYLLRGTAFLINGDYDKAVRDFDEAIRIDPKLDSAYSFRGEIRQKQSNYNEAILNYAEAVKLDPKNARHIFNFLDVAKTDSIDIKRDFREKLCQYPDYWISLVGSIFCAITNKECYLPYINLASLPESVGTFWLGQVSESVK